MTRLKNDAKRVSELNVLFMALNNKGQDSALVILRSLGFAQSVMSLSKPSKTTTKKPA